MWRVALLLSMQSLNCLAGCGPAAEEVVVFTALDREFSEPILQRFQQETGIRVRPKFDVESTKTVQLVARIMNEKRATCDVFWNNEILHTLRLQRRGLLDRYQAEAASDFPADYRSTEGYWYGLAARARVLIVNTELIGRDQWPSSIHDLTDSAWRDRVGIAKPMFGTTATHAAVLFAVWGDGRAREYYRDVRNNARVLSGNKQVAAAVGRGQLAWGITDTDDAVIERDQGRPVAIVFPDQQPGGLGALFIPNTVCVIRDGPHPEHARRLIEYLLSPAVEAELAAGRSAQFPVNPDVEIRSRVLRDESIVWMDVDFQAAADQWEATMRFLRDEFGQ